MTTLTKVDAQQVANTTLKQLGGAGRLSAMINARDFGFATDGSLTFKFSSCRKANAVRISINGSDLYDIKFMKINHRNLCVATVAEFNNIYCDQLKSTIEQFTGLYLSL